VSGEIVIGVRDVIALLIGLGAPLAVYVAMRERLVKLETVILHLTKTIEEQGHARTSHGSDIGDIRETLADHAARLHALEGAASRVHTGSFGALSAETTGPHRTLK
jgi:hypothetical protein